MHHLDRPGRARLAAATVLVLVLVASLGACTGSGSSSGSGASPSAGGITVTGAWVRNSPAVAGAVAGYFVVSNGGAAADSLLSASTPIAKTVQLHKTVVMGSAAPSASSAGMGSAVPSAAPSGGTGSGGMMGMVPVDRVDIPAGGSVEFKPGSYHLMIMDLTGTLTVGQTVDLTLVFEKAGTITVKAEVRAS